MISIDKYYLFDLLYNILVITIPGYQNIKIEICGDGNWKYILLGIDYSDGEQLISLFWRKTVAPEMSIITILDYKINFYNNLIF